MASFNATTVAAMLLVVSSAAAMSSAPSLDYNEKQFYTGFVKSHLVVLEYQVELLLRVMIEPAMNDPSLNPIMTTCKTAYESSLELLNDGIKKFNSGEILSAIADVEGFTPRIGECKIDEVKIFNSWASAVAKDCGDKLEELQTLRHRMLG